MRWRADTIVVSTSNSLADRSHPYGYFDASVRCGSAALQVLQALGDARDVLVAATRNTSRTYIPIIFLLFWQWMYELVGALVPSVPASQTTAARDDHSLRPTHTCSACAAHATRFLHHHTECRPRTPRALSQIARSSPFLARSDLRLRGARDASRWIYQAATSRTRGWL